MELPHKCHDILKENELLRKHLNESYETIILLMKQLEWGAATAALYEDPVVKRARHALGV